MFRKMFRKNPHYSSLCSIRSCYSPLGQLPFLRAYFLSGLVGFGFGFAWVEGGFQWGILPEICISPIWIVCLLLWPDYPQDSWISAICLCISLAANILHGVCGIRWLELQPRLGLGGPGRFSSLWERQVNCFSRGKSGHWRGLNWRGKRKDGMNPDYTDHCRKFFSMMNLHVFLRTYFMSSTMWMSVGNIKEV